MAALLVLFEHVRALVFVDFGMVGDGVKAVALPFYLSTTLGHQAVIAFFALSGFLVGGPALTAIKKLSFNMTRYLVARFSRLWTVLLPALFITLAFDLLGRSIGVEGAYTGELRDLVQSGPTGSNDELTAATFVQNLFFLQTISAPTFGSNGPLWSLSNEFWYYILGPLIGVALIWRARPIACLLCGVLFVAIAILLPLDMLILGLIWVGAAIYRNIYHVVERRRLLSRFLFLAALSLVVSTTLISARGGGIIMELLLGFGWTLLLPVLAGRTVNPRTAYAKFSLGISEISFTLYAVHFPIIYFVWAYVLRGRQFDFAPEGVAWFGGIAVVGILASSLLWWLFEHRTNVVKQMIQKIILRE